jgi:transposase InsO family protein
MTFKVIAKARELKTSFSLVNICKKLKVSRSGFYKSQSSSHNGDKDQNSFKLIKKVFEDKREKIGIRQIKMLLSDRYKVVMNKKKIARIKNKFHLTTKIRRKNGYKKFAKKIHEHKACPNFLNREFTRSKADDVYSTDITQFNYGEGKKAYLAVFKDLGTKEIVASELSKRMDINLVNGALDKALSKLSYKKRKKLMIHSDQGFHFTHFKYRGKLQENGITQSMSRKGNCIDNAPVESFFGYLKDHVELKGCDSFEKLKNKVTREIDYYNNERPMWDLKKMPPSLYRRHLES